MSAKNFLFVTAFISIAAIIAIAGYSYFAKQKPALAQTQNIYWVDDNGAAAWINCKSNTPLSDASACSLAVANTNAIAGDVINIRDGIYTNQTIQPYNSGTSGSKIIYQAYTGEHPILDDTGEVVGFPYGYGVYLNGKSYIVIDGLEIRNQEYLVFMDNGSSYNEIKNCVIHDSIYNLTQSAGIAVLIKDSGDDNGGSNHNWIHDNTIYNHGHIDSICQDTGGLIRLGSGDSTSYLSDYNTIENNILYHGGHDTLSVQTMRNVIRDNISRNDAFMSDESSGCSPLIQSWRNTGKWGNRNFAFQDGNNRDGMYNLIEKNRVGYASNPPDGGGADGINLTGKKIIARYNSIIDAGEKGLYFKQITGGDSDNNRAYNNTIYHSGYSYGQLGNVSFASLYIHSNSSNNIIKNNLIYDRHASVVDLRVLNAGDFNTIVNNWWTTDGDPKFVDVSGMPSVTDVTGYDFTQFATVPNLNLQANSSAINAGAHLTQANGAGINSATLVVDDALYFQDGTWGSSLSDIQPDWIAIGSVNNVVQISSIDYSANTITLATPITWSDNAPIWLYKDSSGRIILTGLAPDIGAYEYIQAPPPLKADFNSDQKVNNLDFTSFKNAFKSIFNSIFNLNSDNTIDVKDLGVLMSSWLP